MLAAALLWASCVPPARAQIDPKPRQLVQVGWDQPLSGGSPTGYGFYYLNRPDFYRRDRTLRLVTAPVYVDSELGFRRIAPQTDLGVGLSGGGFAYGHNEIRHGATVRPESFDGNGFALAASLYHLFNPGKRIPLNLVLRASSIFSSFDRRSKTDPAFSLPTDHFTNAFRAGLRWGGKPPELRKTAMEVSAWYEARLRPHQYEFGFDDRSLRADTQLFWTRGLLAYNFPDGRYASANVTMGTSANADRLNAWQLGGALPFVSEFPLNIPGYAYQELTARSFALADLRFLQPVDPAKRFGVGFWGAAASVDYLPGFEQPGSLNSGVGGWMQFVSPRKRWVVGLLYGYGVQALRAHGRGANSVGLTLQYNIGTPAWRLPFEPGAPSERPRGFTYY